MTDGFANTMPGATVPVAHGPRPFAGARIDLVDSRYRPLAELGAGGMGSVMRAVDVSLDRDVALKLIAREFAGDGDMVERFRKEASALARVRSQYVVQVFAFGRHEGTAYFAMEYVRGVSLHAVIDAHNQNKARVPVKRAVGILARISEGLGDVHAAGLVHRDIKPANIVIEEGTGRPVVVDFGLAYRKSSDLAQPLECAGTPAYMAPEQVGGAVPSHLVTPQVDIYALGCTMYEVLVGEPPFVRDSVDETLRAHLASPLPKLADSHPELAPLDEVLERSLAKAPDARFASCRAFGDSLREAASRIAEEPLEAGARPLPRPSAPGGALRILVVEDDPAFRRLAMRAAQLAFHSTPIEIDSAETGREALTLCGRVAPDLLLLDYDLPGMNGIDVLSNVRELESGFRTRVVVMSASAGREQKWRFSVLGVEEFLDKPVGFKALVEDLRRIGARAGLERPEPALPSP